MLISALINIFTSTVWNKLFIDFVILYYFQHIQKKRQITPIIRTFPLFIWILISRDILYQLFKLGEIIIIADIITITVYIIWLRKYTGYKKEDRVVFPLTSIMCITMIVNNIFFFIPPFWDFTFRLYAIIYAIYFSNSAYQISEYNTKNPEMILAARGGVSFILITYNFLMLFTGEYNPIAHAIIIPISGFVHFFVLQQYTHKSEVENEIKTDQLEKEIEALFDFMRNVGNAITERVELSRVLDYIVNSAVANTHADAGAILLVDDFEDILVVKAMTGIFPPPYPVPDSVKKWSRSIQGYFESNPIKIGETIVGEVVKTGQPIFIKNTIDDPRTEQNTKNDALFISSIIVIPLIVSSKILGVLSIIKRRSDNFFNDLDFKNIRTFADYTSLTLDNLLTYMELMEKKEIEREVGIAADIQNKLLPGKLPAFKNTKLSAFSIPAKGVSGDYYDVIPLKNDKIALVICDVAGKGVPASLVMVMIRTIIHLISSADKDVATILNWINRGISGQIDIDHFATLSYLTYDQKTRRLDYSNAAHHPLFLYKSKTNSVQNVDTEGLPIGIEKSSKYKHKSLILDKDDLLILYTDGIIEAMNVNGEQYGYDSLKRTVLENTKLDPTQLSGIIRNDIAKFVGKARQHDDQTMLIMKTY